MVKFRFFSRFPMTQAVTGGNIYDSAVLSILQNIKGIDAECVPLDDKGHPYSLLFSPFYYIKKGLPQIDCDLIIFNSALFMRFLPLMFVLKFFFRKKTLVIHHHFMYRQFRGLKRWLYKQCEWRFLKLSSNIVVASPYVYDELKDYIDINKLIYWRIPFEAVPSFNSNPIVGNLTYMGTIESRKGLHFLMEALQKMQSKGINYHLTIIGKTVEEPYRKNIDNYISDHSINAHFTGFISKEEKEKILSETDIFVFPSQLEGFGMVLVEAQVYGLPIVCFNNSAMPFSVFDNINGFVVPNKDTTKFAEAIEKIISDRNLRNHMSKEAQLNASKQNTHDKFCKDIIDYVKHHYLTKS